MSLFHHNTVRFSKPDPLANGLAEEIVAEQREADSFKTLDDMPADELDRHWDAIIDDIEKDPNWFSFTND